MGKMNRLGKASLPVQKLTLTAMYALLFLGLTLLFPAVRLYYAPQSGGVWAYRLIFTGLFAMVLLPAALYRRVKSVSLFSLLALLTGGALLLRMVMLDEVSGDYTSFLEPWVEVMRPMGLKEALSQEIGNYNVPYMALLWGISRLPVVPFYPIKLLSICFDLLLAWYAARLMLLAKDKMAFALSAFCIVLLLPTVAINSGWWAQCDSIYAMFLLGGLYYGIRGQGWRCCVFFVLSLCFKLQTVFLMPLLLPFLMLKKVRWLQLSALPVCYLAGILPALLAGRPLLDTLTIYFQQMGEYPLLTLSCPNLYSFFSVYFSSALSGAGLVLGVLFVLSLLWLLLRKGHKLRPEGWIQAGFVLSLGLIYLLPHMHERYSYPSDLLAVLTAFCDRRMLLPAAICQTVSALSYLPFLTEQLPVVSFPLLSLLRLTALLAGLYRLMLYFWEDNGSSSPKEEKTIDTP